MAFHPKTRPANYNVVDRDWFFDKDPIAEAEDAGSMPTQGFRPYSNNVKPPVNGKKAAKAQMGVSSGFVRDSLEPQKDNVLSKSARKRARRTGKLPAAWR